MDKWHSNRNESNEEIVNITPLVLLLGVAVIKNTSGWESIEIGTRNKDFEITFS